jgi:competence protein ComEA
MFSNRLQLNSASDTFKQEIAQQQTHPYPSVSSTPHMILTMPTAIPGNNQEQAENNEQQKKNNPRIIATIAVGLIALILYLVWQPATPATPVTANTQYTPSPKILTPNPTDTLNSTGGTIQVYIIGAVQHPGVYTLENNARVYQLLQAAGGTLSGANLAAINMAARLSDGQEIYLPHVGETPIAALSGTTSGSSSALVNINTASASQLQLGLSLSSKSAQTIVNYRLQHGPFSSVDALAQAVSKTIYDKIKDKVTV